MRERAGAPASASRGGLGLARARLAAYEERPLEGEGAVHRRFKLGRGQGRVGAAEADEVHSPVLANAAGAVRPAFRGRTTGRSARRACRATRRRTPPPP